MSLLSDALSRAKQDIGNNSSNSKQQLQFGISNAVSARVNQVVNVPRNLEAQVTQVGINAAVGAASDILHGDLSGAAARVFGLPGQVATQSSQILGGLGLTFGSTLSGPSQGLATYGVGGAIQGGNALAGALARTDPMMSFLWYCEPPALLGNGGSATLPWYFVEEATLPFRTYETRGVYREGRSRTYASKYSIDGLSLTFYLDVGGLALSYLMNWDGLIMQPFAANDNILGAGKFRMPNAYKKSIPIYLIDPNKKQLVRFTYTECWPTNINSLTLQSNASEHLTAQVSFSCGDVFVDVITLAGNIAQFAGASGTAGNVGSTVNSLFSRFDRSTQSSSFSPAQTFPINLGL